MTLGCNWHRWPEVHARFSQTLRGALLHRAHATGAETAEAKAELERQSPGSTEYYRVAAKHHRAFATRFGHQIRALSGWERTSMAGILELFENLAALSEALAEGRPPPQFFTNHERTRARQLCDAALFAGSDDEQEQLYRSAVELDPACADVRVALGLFLGERSRFEEASAHLRTALTLDGDYDDARRLLVATLRFARLFDEALAEATLHAERNPENPEAWILRAQVLLDMGRPAEAAADLQRALDLAPQHPEAHRVMASIQIALGNTTVARRHATLHEKYRGALPPRPLHLLPIPPRSS